LKKKLQELIYYYKKKGLKDTVKRITARYTRILRFRINATELTDNFYGPELEPEYTLIIDDFSVLEKLRNDRDDLPREFYVDKTHGGRRFYLILLNFEPVYIHWLFGKNEFSKFCDIQDEKTVELQYAYTMPKFRGNRIVGKALKFSCQDLYQKGYKRVVNVVSEGNVNVIKGMKFSGLTPIAHVNSYFSFIKKVKV